MRISTRRTCPATQGALSNYKNLRAEPADHGIGRSRGGLSTKIHQLVDGHGLPLVVMVGAGQAGDSPMFPVLMDHLRVARRGPGRPRTARPGPRATRRTRRERSASTCAPAGSSRSSPSHPTSKDTANAAAPQGGRPVSIRHRRLPRPQRRRARIQRHQAMARPRHPLRQTRPHLPRRSRPPSNHTLAPN